MIKSRRLRWTEHEARTGEKWGAWKVLMGKPEGRRPLGRPRLMWEDNIKTDLWKVWWAWTVSVWLRIGTGGGLLSIRWWTFGFHKKKRISWVAEELLASQKGVCSMELVSNFVYIFIAPWQKNVYNVFYVAGSKCTLALLVQHCKKWLNPTEYAYVIDTKNAAFWLLLVALSLLLLHNTWLSSENKSFHTRK